MDRTPSVGFERALVDAYRHGCQEDREQIGTDLVLYHVVPRAGALRRRLGGGGHRGWRAATRGRPGLVDPAPPARTRLDPDFDNDVAFEADAVLREASYFGLR